MLRLRFLIVTSFITMLSASLLVGATALKHYFAHDVVEDRYGVIAPWYKGQNGQFDLRVRIAAETMKRYPWTTRENAVAVVPQFVLNGTWHISPDGAISIPPLSNWANGDLGEMAAREMAAYVDYYRYSGDPAALAGLSLIANTVLDHCLTSSDYAWPNFLISVPVTGKPYGNCDPTGWMQLDIVGEFGVALLNAYEAMGETRWLEAVKHFADVLAEKRTRDPRLAPWGRYANPQDVKWGLSKDGNLQTGGVVFELAMFDELIRLGDTGPDSAIVQARDQARAYLRDVLLPNWTINDSWGRNYWDWQNPVQVQTVTDWLVTYLLANKTYFVNWKNDIRNIVAIYFNHTSANPKSAGEVYSGAWALPESSGCCGSSLAWAPVELAADLAQYAHDTHSEWAREIARRQLILGTYDSHSNGVVEDNIFGGQLAAGGWFISAHPSMLEWTLRAMGWMPEITGPARENHIMRSTSTVKRLVYGKAGLIYSTFAAPDDSVDVLRLAFRPRLVTAGGQALELRRDLSSNGYTAEALVNGDYVVEIRHDGQTQVAIEGENPETAVGANALRYAGAWSAGPSHRTETAGAAAAFTFTGNRLRVIGEVGPRGGLADVYVDGARQAAGIDFWNPRPMPEQAVFFTNGLSNGRHSIRIVASGAANPVSQGKQVELDGVQYSAATGGGNFGEGGGPTDAQRLIFGYTGRSDYVDTEGHAWRPGAEFVARTGARSDSIAKTWYTMRQAVFIQSTPDEELYRYGIHWPEFVVNLTVGPGTYHVRIKLAETQFTAPLQRAMTVSINGEPKASRMDVFATAGAANTAVDLVYDNVRPRNGIIAIGFSGDTLQGRRSEALVQAIEVGPGPGGPGASPKTAGD